MTVPWSTGPLAPKTELKYPQSHYSGNLALRILQQSVVVGSWDNMDMYSVPRPVSNLSQTCRFPAPEGKEGIERQDLNVSRLISLIAAWLGWTHKTEMLGEPEFSVASCCQPHWMGQGQHPNIKMDMMMMMMLNIPQWVLINISSGNSFQLS